MLELNRFKTWSYAFEILSQKSYTKLANVSGTSNTFVMHNVILSARVKEHQLCNCTNER